MSLFTVFVKLQLKVVKSVCMYSGAHTHPCDLYVMYFRWQVTLHAIFWSYARCPVVALLWLGSHSFQPALTFFSRTYVNVGRERRSSIHHTRTHHKRVQTHISQLSLDLVIYLLGCANQNATIYLSDLSHWLARQF